MDVASVCDGGRKGAPGDRGGGAGSSKSAPQQKRGGVQHAWRGVRAVTILLVILPLHFLLSCLQQMAKYSKKPTAAVMCIPTMLQIICQDTPCERNQALLCIQKALCIYQYVKQRNTNLIHVCLVVQIYRHKLYILSLVFGATLSHLYFGLIINRPENLLWIFSDPLSWSDSFFALSQTN